MYLLLLFSIPLNQNNIECVIVSMICNLILIYVTDCCLCQVINWKLMFDLHVDQLDGIMSVRCFKFYRRSAVTNADGDYTVLTQYRVDMYRDEQGKKHGWKPPNGAVVWKKTSGLVQRSEARFMPRKPVKLERWQKTYNTLEHRMSAEQKADWLQFYTEQKQYSTTACKFCTQVRAVQWRNRQRQGDSKKTESRKKKILNSTKKALRDHLLDDEAADSHPIPGDDDCWPLFGSFGSALRVADEEKLQQLSPMMEEMKLEDDLQSDEVCHDQMGREVFAMGRNRDKQLPNLKLGWFVLAQPDVTDWVKGQDFYLGKLIAFDEEQEFQATVHWYSNAGNTTDEKATFEAGWTINKPDGKTKKKNKSKQRHKGSGNNKDKGEADDAKDNGANQVYVYTNTRPKNKCVQAYQNKIYKQSLLVWGENVLTTKHQLRATFRRKINVRLHRAGMVRPGKCA